MGGMLKPAESLVLMSLSGRHRFWAHARYEEVEEELCEEEHKPPFHDLLRELGYIWVDTMTDENMLASIRKLYPSARKVEGVLVQSVPIWVGTEIRRSLFFQALYSWNEFWDTVAAGWGIYGDPRAVSNSEWAEWVTERIAAPHGGYFVGRGVSFLLWPREALSDKIPRGIVLYDHAYRVMDWLGFTEATMPMWWLLAFVAGMEEKTETWLPWFQSETAYFVLENVKACEDMVRNKAKDIMPIAPATASTLCPPQEYDITSMKREGRYSQFNPRLFFPKYRKYLEAPSTYMPDPLTRRKLEAIGKIWGQERDLEQEARDKAAASKKLIQELREHPMYRLIQAAKFKIAESGQEKLRKIASLTEQCHQGEVGVEALLEWAWKAEHNEHLRLELAQATRGGEDRFRRKRIALGNKLYKQVHGWFRRRNWSMPECPRNWREKIITI